MEPKRQRGAQNQAGGEGQDPLGLQVLSQWTVASGAVFSNVLLLKPIKTFVFLGIVEVGFSTSPQKLVYFVNKRFELRIYSLVFRFELRTYSLFIYQFSHTPLGLAARRIQICIVFCFCRSTGQLSIVELPFLFVISYTPYIYSYYVLGDLSSQKYDMFRYGLLISDLLFLPCREKRLADYRH